MRIDIITVLPEMLEGFFNCSIMSRAQKKGIAEIHIHNLRDYAYDRYRKVDDYPFGGFAGMVMKIEPIDRCISALKAEREYDEIIFTSPDGEQFNQPMANSLSLAKNLIILCALSVGDISDNGIGEQRKNVFKKMLSVCFVEDLDYQVEEKIQKIKTTLTSVIERYVAGEEIRIWYSYNPDELCGMYWLMKQLQPLNCQTTIYLVKLPTWEYGKENTMTSKIAWGEVSPGEWGNYITLQEKANPVFLSACAMKWNQLQNENAPLRAMLNGKLQSVSEDIYDSFILREIAEQPEQFKMAIVIGNVLGKYQLGISDVWISNRIDKMLEDGVLEIIQDAPKGETNYRRILRKRMK